MLSVLWRSPAVSEVCSHQKLAFCGICKDLAGHQNASAGLDVGRLCSRQQTGQDGTSAPGHICLGNGRMSVEE